MKLLKEELTQPMQFITEGSGESTCYYMQGPFLQAEVKNRNGRIYPLSIMENAVNMYTESHIKTKRAYGELSHPEGPQINLDRVSHLIESLTLEGSTYYGKAKIIEGLPCGKIVAELLKAGASVGVSSRGLGSIKESNGISYVQDDFRLATAADVVADPSAPDAFVQGLMEEAEWIWDSGIWKMKSLENARDKIRKAATRKIMEAKMEQFESLFKTL